MSLTQPPVLAAGAVVWRLMDGRARVLLVHRPGHGDVSLPKGKVDPGETLPQTAVREILEETGLAVVLGAPLGTVEYVMPNGRDKVVHYWSAEVDDHALELARFQSNAEISALEWIDLEKAHKRLSYPHDREILDRFAKRLKKDRARTFAVIAVRHGKAVPHGSWDGPDATRPLMQRGVDQAASIAGGIAAYGIERIVSSTATRCLATVAPLASLTGIPIKATDAISQDAYEHGADAVASIVARRLKRKVSTALCSHGPVLPQILAELAAQTGTEADAALRRGAALDTGEFTVIHVARGGSRKRGIVAVETHSPV